MPHAVADLSRASVGSPSGDPSGRARREVLVDPRGLPEMSARVSFLSQPITAEQQQPLTAVASGALTQSEGRTVLYVVRGDKAVEVAVTPGRKLGKLTTFAGDARSGEQALLGPVPELEADALIKPAPQRPEPRGE